jgi:hypothetical protein
VTLLAFERTFRSRGGGRQKQSEDKLYPTEEGQVCNPQDPPQSEVWVRHRAVAEEHIQDHLPRPVLSASSLDGETGKADAGAEADENSAVLACQMPSVIDPVMAASARHDMAAVGSPFHG